MKKVIMCLVSISLVSMVNAQSWTPYSVGSAAQVMRIEFPVDDTGYVNMDNGSMRKTTNGAVNWSICTPPMNYFSCMAFVNGTKGFGSGQYGIKMTTDGASTWNYVEYDSVKSAIDFQVVSASLIYAAYTDPTGTSLYLYKSTNGGLNWNLMPVTTMVISYGDMLFVNSDTGYFSAADCIFKTTNGGVSWDTSYFDVNGDMITYLGSNDGVNIYAASQSLQFLVSTDAGASWNPVGPGNPLPVYGISFISPQTGFVAGGDGISSGFIDRTINGGLTWTNVYNGVSLNCMDFPSNIRGYAGGKNGTVLKLELGPQGIDERGNSELVVYPNPAHNSVTLDNVSVGSTISVVNSLGEEVVSFVATTSITTIDLTAFSTGVYFLRVITEEKASMVKLIVK